MFCSVSYNLDPPYLKQCKTLQSRGLFGYTSLSGHVLFPLSPLSAHFSLMVRCMLWPKEQQQSSQSWRMKHRGLAGVHPAHYSGTNSWESCSGTLHSQAGLCPSFSPNAPARRDPYLTFSTRKLSVIITAHCDLHWDLTLSPHPLPIPWAVK